jgi:uncharacterized protein
MRLSRKTGIMRRLLFKLLLLAAICAPPCIAAQAYAVTPEPPSTPRTYVVDMAGIIQKEHNAKLTAYLKELEQKTTAQVIILTVQSLDGEAIADFTQRTFEKWKLGKKGKDNGLLIVISLKDRKYRFHTGYGLEGILPDSKLGSIGRDYLVPYFRKGDYGSGIFSATLVIINTIAVAQGVEITGMPKTRGRAQKSASWSDIVGIAIFAVFFIPFILFSLFRRATGGRSGGGYWGGGGYYGGGGFGGGGDSGFGGGGGGDSGGGGADGSW